ncbi:hypothetical protein CVD25_09390 [Bacillus canaveralius]|uniref:Esterase family protein n=1 Tax=Bacillus canaveralius TaxID=1403243 RepID=A0A2N5GKM2_9BACI|nr:esterase family protein [Bacillus canaveralius]PLR82073.1 hypothetical protein CU635_12950 [Bacillus canaveralius]PLR98021.1 hypothetical protein CVD25_09390 [Bacillus canaveralius]
MEIPRGTIKDMTIPSKELGEDVNILVYLPASFSPLYKYSLLIASDGKDYFQFGRIGRIADELLHNKEIENVIIIGVPYKDVKDRREKYHPQGSQQKNYIRFLAHELVPFLDKQFPTYQMGMGRALIGDSLAATVSLMTALEYPNIFGRIILQSPFVNDRVLELVEAFQSPPLVHIYHVVGNQETNVKTSSENDRDFLTPNRHLAEVFQKKSFPYHFEEFAGNHTWSYWQPNLRQALGTMF